MRPLLRALKRIGNRTLGTLTDLLFWKFRHLIDPRWAEQYLSEASLAHPHRKLLLDAIARHAPFETALEVGCASGPNLYLLARRFPGARLYGVDVSKKAVQVGAEWLKTKDVHTVSLAQGKLWDLRTFGDKSVDVVFSDAALIYAGPERIETVLIEMLRVAKKTVVLNEWHDPAGPRYEGHWIYDYQTLLIKLAPEATIALTKIPEAVWDGSWATYGYLIECAFKK